MLGKPRVIRGMYRMGGMMAKRSAFLDIIKEKGVLVLDGALGTELEPVSYTHLTLPTIRLV